MKITSSIYVNMSDVLSNVMVHDRRKFKHLSRADTFLLTFQAFHEPYGQEEKYKCMSSIYSTTKFKFIWLNVNCKTDKIKLKCYNIKKFGSLKWNKDFIENFRYVCCCCCCWWKKTNLFFFFASSAQIRDTKELKNWPSVLNIAKQSTTHKAFNGKS